MRTPPLLLILGIAQIILGFQYGWWGAFLIWSGLCFAAVGIAYAKRLPGIFGKRPDGTLAPGRVLLLLPYLLFTWAVWFLDTHIRSENACDEITPGLWLGRWPTTRDMPPGVTQIVDLTSEFTARRAVRDGRLYLLLPTLDATPPDREAALRIAQQVADSHEPTYIHCALGHGRSALVTALVLIKRGDAANVEDALALLRRARPGVKLNPGQQAWLHDAARPEV
jgi:protein-tyrosine phosphatase